MTSLIEVNFDNSIEILACFIKDELGLDQLVGGIFLRDGFGRVAFYASIRIPKAKMKKLNQFASAKLGRHGAVAGPIFDAASPGALSLETGVKKALSLWIGDKKHPIKIVDRRFYGRDWQASPKSADDDLAPIFVFNSLKGGVGRTTALFFLSVYLSRQGKNVLLIDMDLEAPGLASLVFGPRDRPRFGVVDYLTEISLGGVEDADLRHFVGLSNLTDRAAGQGRVDLVPAAGQQTYDSPDGMMGKLARALLESPQDDGGTITLAQQIKIMVRRFAAMANYDAILIDARAGLAEVSAAPLIELGGWNLFFGTDHPHTFEGYRYLLSHLSTLPVVADDDWRERISFVHAKAPVSEEKRVAYNDSLYEVISEHLYEMDVDSGVFNYSLSDEGAPHYSWPIYMSGDFVDVDPIRDKAILEDGVYRGIFGDFIDRVLAVMGEGSSDGNVRGLIT